MRAKRFAIVGIVGVAVAMLTFTLVLTQGAQADHVWKGSFAQAVGLGGGSLNIRACAGLNCRVLGTIPEGQATYITGDAVYKDGYWWYPHDFRRTVGYSASKYLLSGNGGGGGGGTVQSPIRSGSGSSLVRSAANYIGTRFVMGGTSPRSGWDCSGFTQYIFRQYGVNLPRSAAEQWRVGQPVSRSDLQPGDLVFFAGTFGPGISHVAIYAGNGKMVNAQSERVGTVMGNVFDAYWGAHYAGARRVL